MPKMKGPRPKHIPLRTCIACRRSSAKRDLVRIVCTTEGRVQVDHSGKVAGRGAYLCRDRGCWLQALGGQRLSTALRKPLNAEELSVLRAFAETLPEKAPDAA